MYIFISHSSNDAGVANEICAILEKNNSNCFIAPRNIRTGYEYASEILDGIDKSDVFLLLMSKTANTSPHVLREVERAVSKSIPIIVYCLEDVVLSKSLEYFLMTHQWFNATENNYDSLVKCIEDMKDNTNTAISTDAPTPCPNITLVPEPKKTNLPVLIGSISALIVIIILCLVLLITSSGDDKNESTLPSTSTQASSDSTNNTISETASKDTARDETVNNEPVTEITTDFSVGDIVTFGKYNDADIQWYIVNISSDKKEAVLISKNIVSFKGFSGADSGKFAHILDADNKYAYHYSKEDIENKDIETLIRGNNSWDKSDIRVWLNSDTEVVKYSDYGPTPSAMADGRNGYNLEPGFLYQFSDDEKNAIKDTAVETKINSGDDATVSTIDKVFLFSKDEVQWLKASNIPEYVEPTEEAITKNEDFHYRDYCLGVYKTKSSPWWLRDPLEDSLSQNYAVGYGHNIDNEFVNFITCVEGIGIRPAVTVDLSTGFITK